MQLASERPSLAGQCAHTGAAPPTPAAGPPEPGRLACPLASSGHRGWLVDWSRCATRAKRVPSRGLPASPRCGVPLLRLSRLGGGAS